MHRAQTFARRLPYMLQCDVRHYYETVDHAVLKALLRRKLKDQRLLALLDHIIDHPLPGSLPGKGLPSGNLTSQYFANLYLGELDHLVKERLRLKGYVRYMDDILVFAETKAHLHATLASMRSFLHDTLRLTLKEEVVRIAPVTQGIAFLGVRIYPGLIRLQRKTLVRFGRRVRQREAQYQCGMIDEETLARSVASVVGHIRHANTLTARRASLTAARLLG